MTPPDPTAHGRRPGPSDRGGALPVVVVGGLHRDARNAAVERLLTAVPGSVALHHDLSDATAGSVRRTVRERGGLLDTGHVPLSNDCACCALREDLVPELLRLAGVGACRLAVVELWDSVEPKAMAEIIAAHAGDELRLAGVVVAVDPALVLPALANGDDLAEAGLAAAPSDQRTVADTFARQLEYPNVLALVEGEEVPDETDRALLAQLHPTARRLPVAHPDFPSAATAGFGVAEAAERQHPACALLPQDGSADGVGTLVWRSRRPFHPGRLYAALEELCCAAARSRGRFWLADRPDTLLHWDCAGGALCVESVGPWLASLPDAAWDLAPAVRRAAAALDWDPEHGDRVQHLVFVSPDLDRENLAALLESCLLTEAEYAAGRVGWKQLSTAFDDLLDQAA